ncbi:MAG: sigma-70 family RNA polymerase sigma factor [Calditerrivibrio sp.]|nr:sigma-70 family RNA polymerase sigma factor [Calditerrivibrio sp.]MCA1980339.1 sigma-70 family RNA polymerase sigma factor [Calditerrivibrio sp.]
MSEIVLIDKVLNGDASAFEFLILKYQKNIYGTVFNIVKEDELTKDIVQESFLKAYENLNSLRSREQFYPWLKKIAINLSLIKLDRNKRYVDMYRDDKEEDDFFFNNQTDESNPEQELLTEELRRYVRKFVDSLPEKLRRVIILREVEDLSYEEIASILNIPVGTVRSRLFNARQIIKDRLLRQGLADGLYRVS